MRARSASCSTKDNEAKGHRLPHVWIPHSLGALKKHNMDPATWADLHIDERIANEKELLKSVDGGVATSTAIRDTLRQDYGYQARYFLPPCIDEVRYCVRYDGEVESGWAFFGRSVRADYRTAEAAQDRHRDQPYGQGPSAKTS